MTKENSKLRIYGAGGHSRVIRDLSSLLGYEVISVYDDNPILTGTGAPSVERGIRLASGIFDRRDIPLVIGIGDNRERAHLDKILDCHYLKLIHPGSIVSSCASIGDGTVVYAGAIIQPNTKIGRHVIINTGSSVDHDNILENYVHISPGAALSGHVTIGEGTQVGAGAAVLPLVKIGRWCTIGAGAVILNDVPDYAVVVGTPGRIIKYNK